MKLLFVHDGTLKYDEDGKYFGITVNPTTLLRYKKMSDDITILIRTEPLAEGESKDRYTEISSEYRVVHCPNYMSLKGMLFDRKKVKQTVKKLVAEADLVVARFSGETGKIAARQAEKTGTPYIVECVCCYWDSLWNYNLKGKFMAPYSFLSARSLIKKAPYVIYVTNHFLQTRYPTLGTSVHASNVELKEMDRTYLNKRLEKISNMMQDQTMVLGTAAAIDVPFKGHAYVIEAISILNKEGRNFKYQILGAGDKRRLLNIAKNFGVDDVVEFLGVKPHEQVFDWIDGLDVYVQPSDQEGLPRALIEAMSRACPAVGSTTAGIPELLAASCLFQRKHVDGLVEVLRTMDKEKMIKYAKLNFDTAMGYQRDIIYERRNRFFDMVIEASAVAMECEK